MSKFNVIKTAEGQLLINCTVRKGKQVLRIIVAALESTVNGYAIAAYPIKSDWAAKLAHDFMTLPIHQQDRDKVLKLSAHADSMKSNSNSQFINNLHGWS